MISRLKTTDAVAGASVQLAIDLDLQRFVQELLIDKMEEATVAAAVVLNAKTGEVYAMVSVPGYDNNLFTDLQKRNSEYEALAKDPRKPFLNWALSANAPGSTFKLLTAAAGLQQGNITPSSGRTVNSIILEIPGANGEIYPLFDWAAHGYVNFYSAIAKSSNHFFYQASCGVPHEGLKGLGKDSDESAYILAEYARDFGFGVPTGIDIAGESNGIIPTPAWKLAVSQWAELQSGGPHLVLRRHLLHGHRPGRRHCDAAPDCANDRDYRQRWDARDASHRQCSRRYAGERYREHHSRNLDGPDRSAAPRRHPRGYAPVGLE